MTTRSEGFAALESRRFDVLVIGGGITGCGIARDAALRGLSVALVDKGDFASGTSSRSSRLVHGGVRYLEHGHLHLVFESSAERRRLLKLAPHLVRALAFTWPVYKGARIPRWKLGAGLWAYDALAAFRNVGRHRALSRNAVLAAEPRLAEDGLVGGARYYDAATNDARLTLANAIGAVDAGAVVLNHAAATDLTFASGRVSGATIRDALSDRTALVRASVVVNASGPWSDSIKRLDEGAGNSVRGSKGAHIAVPRDRIGNRDALTLLSPADGRVFFVLPANEHAIVGTTDGYTTSSPDDVRATNDDIRYLLDAANAFFPAAGLRDNDVVAAWAGIRPLLPAGNDAPGTASREHAITVSQRGVVSITGGKLTTYRVMAAQVVDAVLSQLGRAKGADATKTAPLPGGDFRNLETLIAAVDDATHDETLSRHLVRQFGTEWRGAWTEIEKPGGRAVIVPGLPYTIGELRYCATFELARTLGDLLIRRTHVAFETRDHGMNAAPMVASALSRELGIDESARSTAVADYEREVASIFTVL
ncbi:MAG: glycerol-3-phosphate dehydrogenase/oxidase [Gemmatimonadaceae bacterium]